MLQDKLPQLIRLSYNIKILVAASYKAKQSLAAKGLTPSIFLDPFYSDRSSNNLQQLSYNFKERQIKPLPQFITIDIDDYTLIRKQDKNSADDIDEQILSKKIMQMLNQENIKYLRDIDKGIFRDRGAIQKFLNNQGFHWFEKANKMFYHALTMGQQNYKVNTSDWPMGVCYIVEVEKQKTCKQIFEKLKNEVQYLVRKLFELSPDQIQSVKPMMIILYDVSKGQVIQQALEYSTFFKNSSNIPSFLIYRLAINGEDSSDQIMWSRFNRPVLYTSYNIKGSDPIRISARQDLSKVQDTIGQHKQTIRKAFETRLDDLIKKYEQANKATKLFANFFKGNAPNDKNYNKEELQSRELADKLFLLEDYKRAYQIYKNISNKMQKRNPLIQNNLCEVIQLCLAMSKFYNLKLKNDPYSEIQRYALDRILKFYENRSKIRLKRYLIFLVYCLHTFRSFNREFIRSHFYINLKQTFSNTSLNLNVISVLLYEQYANFNLFYKTVEYRRYCYELTRVASRFMEVKLFPYGLRCFLIVQSLYRDTFATIEKYQAVQLTHLFIQAKNGKQSLKNLKNAWSIYIEKMETEDLQKNQQELVKLIQNHTRMIREIEKIAPLSLQDFMQPNLQIPIIHSLNLQVKDEMLQFDQKSGIKWQQIGQALLDNKQVMSIGLNHRQFKNYVRSFDFGVPQQKCLIYSFNSNQVTQYALRVNSRSTYVGQPIKLSFYMRNPVRADIQVQDIQIKLKQSLQQVKVESDSKSISIKSFKSSQINFVLTPLQPGFLQLQRISWMFMKILTHYSIKQPSQMKSDTKNCYFKLVVQPAVGCLQAKGYFQDYYYEGQRTEMKIMFYNSGSQTVDRVFIATGQPAVYGFQFKQLPLSIQPGQKKQIVLDMFIPLVHDTIQSGQQKKINKFLILYKTKDRFRITRTINKYNILRVAKIDNLVCERLSMHLHLLSFSKKKTSSSKMDVNSGLEWMILPTGFQIVKKEAADLANQVNYFFFIRRGNYSMAKFQLQSWAHQLSSYPPQFLAVKSPENSLSIRFLWNKQQKIGYIQKSNIPITINENGYLSSTFPISCKVNFQKQIKHNFSKYPFRQIPIKIKLKNVLCPDQLKVTVNFIESFGSDSTWEGTTEKRLNLQMGAQGTLYTNYVVVRPGIYVLSNQIKYSIVNSKAQFVNMTHSDYEKIYLVVKGQEEQKGKFDFDDAFKEFETTQSKTVEVKVVDDLI